MRKFNLSKLFSNYSQKNNQICPNSACGPTNMVQALEYAGWEWNNEFTQAFKQPEDCLLHFTRTNKDVLEYYRTKYKNMYDNWTEEASEIAEKKGIELWEAECLKSYPPNELHDVMSYATNLFIGYTAEDLKKLPKRPVTRFYNSFTESDVAKSILQEKPVVTSVVFRGGGHYVTIVGLVVDDNFDVDVALGMDKVAAKANCEHIISYIIDNTYGKFNFETNSYEAVSGNDEEIPRSTFLSIVRPVSHFFSKGAATVC